MRFCWNEGSGPHGYGRLKGSRSRWIHETMESPLMNEKLVYEAMKKAKELNVPLSFHEEDPAFISENGINAGAVAKSLESQVPRHLPRILSWLVTA